MGTNSANCVKIAQGIRLWRLYSTFRSNLSTNFNFGPLLHATFHTHRCNVSPLLGEKPQNRPLSKLNTGRLALRAMLPVTTCWHGYLSGARCKRFAYGPADATSCFIVIHTSLIFLVLAYPGCPGKEATKQVTVSL